tara:strand:- start:479 stop:1288 length:810 start_codon:yes stop_codon:yes gene_type:complete
MGNGIAHVSALSGYKVCLVDSEQKALDKAIDTIDNNMTRQITKGIVSKDEVENAKNNIITSINIEKSSQSDLIIEAIPEDLSLKKKLFKQLDSIIKETAILATNTSSISISDLAKATSRPDNVIGMHFMNPVPVMRLVEVITSEFTSEQTLGTVNQVAKKMGKIAVSCNDYPGFVSNRILMPMINEAIICYDQGVASIEAIDKIMVLGMSHPMGPLKLADLIGLDVCLNIMNVLHEGFQDDKYRPSKMLLEMVSRGVLGKKTGKGFYKY